MSGFVRRAQRNLLKAELRLKEAREELTRQLEWDVVRAQKKAERIAAKKAEEKAARDANPQRIRMETTYLLLTICVKRNLQYTDKLFQMYVEWKKTMEFAPKTNLYQKVSCFLRETFPEEDEEKENAISIYAKTMTGELIPLNYYPHSDKRILQLQLQKIDPEQFPLGSTNIVRLSEDPSAPVQQEEIFGILQHSTKLVTYARHVDDQVKFGFNPENGPCISYQFYVIPAGLVSLAGSELKYSTPFHIFYYPEKKLVDIENISFHPHPLENLAEKIRKTTIMASTDSYPYRYKAGFTQDATEEMVTLFQTLLHD
jgi:hypothetical protein